MKIGGKSLKEFVCVYCGTIHDDPIHDLADAGKLLKIPEIGKDRVFRISAATFAALYPKRPREQNRYKVIGPLLDQMRKRTAWCTVVYDKKLATHRLRIGVRWVGDPGNLPVTEKISVFADEIEYLEEAT